MSILCAVYAAENFKNQILNLRKALDSCDLTHTQQVERIADLQAKKIALEDLVLRFENNNEEYLKISQQIVKQDVSSILSDAKILLRFALLSLTESIRNNPEKYALIYYSIYGRQQQYSSSQNYFIEHRTAMLVEEAEKALQ